MKNVKKHSLILYYKKKRWLEILEKLISKYPGIPKPPKINKEIEILMDKIRDVT